MGYDLNAGETVTLKLNYDDYKCIGKCIGVNMYIKYKIEKVIFNDPATIIYWNDKTKTVVKCQNGDTYDKEKGLLLCIAKKFFGDNGSYNNILKKYLEE